VSGNKANANTGGGGVSVVSGGKFYIETGTVYGKDEGLLLSNTAAAAPGSAALQTTSGAIAQRGTFTGTNGALANEVNLTATDNTITVVNGM